MNLLLGRVYVLLFGSAQRREVSMHGPLLASAKCMIAIIKGTIKEKIKETAERL